MLTVFEGVPKSEISMSELENGIDLVDLLVEKTNFLPSNKEARRALKENSISLNKDKVQGEIKVNASNLVSEKYLLLQRGKKKYFLVKVL